MIRFCSISLILALCFLRPGLAAAGDCCAPARVVGDMPHGGGDFHGAPGPHFDHPDFDHGFHGGGFYPQPYINPWNFVAPVVVNIATAPRMVVNPLTAQPQLMTPGYWQPVNAGTPQQTYTWVPTAVWPLVGSAKPAASTPTPALPRPLLRIRGALRRLIGK